MKDLKLKLD